MTAMPAVQRMTAEEYLAHYDPTRRREELVAGVLIMHEPRLPHEFARSEIEFALQRWSRADGGRGRVTAAIDVKVGEHDVYAPDILWYCAAREPKNDDPWPYPVPDLAVEVRSPSTWRFDVGAKKSGYERAGLPELWLVDTAADEVLVFRRSKPDAPAFDVALELERSETLTSPLLPGFALPLATVFGE
jgi:Uma2 family endonuclease